MLGASCLSDGRQPDSIQADPVGRARAAAAAAAGQASFTAEARQTAAAALGTLAIMTLPRGEGIGRSVIYTETEAAILCVTRAENRCLLGNCAALGEHVNVFMCTVAGVHEWVSVLV